MLPSKHTKIPNELKEKRKWVEKIENARKQQTTQKKIVEIKREKKVRKLYNRKSSCYVSNECFDGLIF